ncbi:hypothetical protein ACFVYR_32030 [Streptomyces sp. NPDC058284]|uniref:hypothetical protein n=1 Tax=unclassified Streptomyces TaxID=2593676 RepID=UPI003658C1B2
MRVTTTRRSSLACIAAVTSGALLATVAPTAMAVDSADTPAAGRVAADRSAWPALTVEQRKFIEDGMGTEARAEISKAMSEQPAGASGS